MTVLEFVSLCEEDSILNVTLFDTATGDAVWSGRGYDLDECDYGDCEVISFDLPKDESITLNIDTSDEP